MGDFNYLNDPRLGLGLAVETEIVIIDEELIIDRVYKGAMADALSGSRPDEHALSVVTPKEKLPA